MPEECKCQLRCCRHFEGVKIVDGVPIDTCAAFPYGIPYAIAYGFHSHLVPVEGDKGLLYEPWQPLV